MKQLLCLITLLAATTSTLGGPPTGVFYFEEGGRHEFQIKLPAPVGIAEFFSVFEHNADDWVLYRGDEVSAFSITDTEAVIDPDEDRITHFIVVLPKLNKIETYHVGPSEELKNTFRAMGADEALLQRRVIWETGR